MTIISQYSIETKVYLNDFLSEKFYIIDADNQMSLGFGQDEPLSCPKNLHTLQNDFIYDYLLFLWFGGQKGQFSKNLTSEKCNF